MLKDITLLSESAQWITMKQTKRVGELGWEGLMRKEQEWFYRW